MQAFSIYNVYKVLNAQQQNAPTERATNKPHKVRTCQTLAQPLNLKSRQSHEESGRQRT